MIAHVVLFRPKPALTEDEREALLVSLEQACSGIPSITRAVIGRRLLLDRPGYETLMAEHYQYSAILEFDSESDLRAYLDHPSHVELGQRLFASADAVLAYDFNVVDASRLRDVI